MEEHFSECKWELHWPTLLRVKAITLTFAPFQNTEKVKGVKLCEHVNQNQFPKMKKTKDSVLEVGMHLFDFDTPLLKRQTIYRL